MSLATIEEQYLNLGCDSDKRDGWLNVDLNPDCNPDLVIDISQDWDLPDEHFRYALASHVFEHLDDVEHAMREAARVIEDGGVLEVRMPLGRDFDTDPTHRTKWTYETPEFFTSNERRPWGPDLPFTLMSRQVHCWWLGPMARVNCLLDVVSKRWPMVAERECHAGELVVHFRRDPR